MRQFPSLAIVLTLAGAPAMIAQPIARRVATAHVDWSEFLGRQDLVWTRLPARWGESVFIGNGRLGATIDTEGGGFGWTINRTDVVHDASRYPIGKVLLKTA